MGGATGSGGTVVVGTKVTLVRVRIGAAVVGGGGGAVVVVVVVVVVEVAAIASRILAHSLVIEAIPSEDCLVETSETRSVGTSLVAE